MEVVSIESFIHYIFLEPEQIGWRTEKSMPSGKILLVFGGIYSRQDSAHHCRDRETRDEREGTTEGGKGRKGKSGGGMRGGGRKEEFLHVETGSSCSARQFIKLRPLITRVWRMIYQ